MSDALGGWDVHTYVIPQAVIAAGEQGRYGMRAETRTLHICTHGVPLHRVCRRALRRVECDASAGIAGQTTRHVRGGAHAARLRPVFRGFLSMGGLLRPGEIAARLIRGLGRRHCGAAPIADQRDHGNGDH